MEENTLVLTVKRRLEQGQGVIVVDLVAADGSPLPPFEAGAHVDLHLGEGLIRQYSLCGDPADRSLYRVGILRDPQSRGGSIAAHARLQEGATLTVGTPRNLFPLDSSAPRSILIGGGIGITPMIAMAYTLHAADSPFELHYCARSAASCAFLEALDSSPFAGQLYTHFDDRDPVQRLDLPTVLGTQDTGTHVYVCGPSGFMDWVLDGARALGFPEGQLHKEYFQVETSTAGIPFEVEARRSGQNVTVGADESIVDALARVGIKVKVSCEQGVCGTCLCTVLEGTPDHRDVYLTDEEKADNDQILLCCSRAKSPKLILDI